MSPESFTTQNTEHDCMPINHMQYLLHFLDLAGIVYFKWSSLFENSIDTLAVFNYYIVAFCFG